MINLDILLGRFGFNLKKFFSNTPLPKIKESEPDIEADNEEAANKNLDIPDNFFDKPFREIKRTTAGSLENDDRLPKQLRESIKYSTPRERLTFDTIGKHIDNAHVKAEERYAKTHKTTAVTTEDWSDLT